MDEILYRGKRKRSMGGDNWIYGSYAKRKNIITGELIHEIGFQLECQEHLTWIEIIPETRGLQLDIDGEKFFEGDIVRDSDEGCLYYIVYCEAFLQFMFCDINTGDYYWNEDFYISEKVGNIHDNPELLEKK